MFADGLLLGGQLLGEGFLIPQEDDLRQQVTGRRIMCKQVACQSFLTACPAQAPACSFWRLQHSLNLAILLPHTAVCPPSLITRREGDDLIFSKRVSLSEALCGTEFTVQTLDGRTLKISTQDSIVQPGSQKVLR